MELKETAEANDERQKISVFQLPNSTHSLFLVSRCPEKDNNPLSVFFSLAGTELESLVTSYPVKYAMIYQGHPTLTESECASWEHACPPPPEVNHTSPNSDMSSFKKEGLFCKKGNIFLHSPLHGQWRKS